MLYSLTVSNIVLIERLTLSIEGGLTVLTGETGAGKSILLDALGLALGSRADFRLIREGADVAHVSAVFRLDASHPVWARLAEADIPPDEELILRRRLKADLARSHLAGKEMAVGRFYIERRHYAAALRRFERVVREYQTSNQVPEALYRMVEAYLALGLIEEADRVGSVAVYNYPDSFWTKELLVLADDPSRELPKGMFQRAIESVAGLFDRE